MNRFCFKKFFHVFGLTDRPKPIRRSKPRAKQRAPRRRVDDPLLKGIWLDLRREWFPDRVDLDEYIVCWSTRRQTRTLASCNITARRVLVARELNHDHLLEWLDPLLYHEMCHAVLGKSVYREHGRSAWHGREFKALERRHPGITTLDHWIKSGGWLRAVRSDRAMRAAHQRHSLHYEAKISVEKS